MASRNDLMLLWHHCYEYPPLYTTNAHKCFYWDWDWWQWCSDVPMGWKQADHCLGQHGQDTGYCITTTAESKLVSFEKETVSIIKDLIWYISVVLVWFGTHILTKWRYSRGRLHKAYVDQNKSINYVSSTYNNASNVGSDSIATNWNLYL